MATLHVRNVPDALYELLREQAARNGRSIGSEAIVLLEGELSRAGRAPSLSLGVPRRRGTTPLDRFGASARRVIVGAQAAAHALARPTIGTEHMLLALLDEPPIEIAVFVLAGAGIDAGVVRAAIGASSAPGVAPEPREAIPFTPGAKRALELALRESIGTRCHEIDLGHLLIGIASEGEGLAVEILRAAGLDAGVIRRALLGPISPVPFTIEVKPGFRVVELTGDAAEWERRLNSLASSGHELVEMVGGRAIFRIASTPR
jgi:plasmid stability protein